MPIGRYSHPAHRCPPDWNDTSVRVAMPTISHQDLVCPTNGQRPSGPVPATRVLRPLATVQIGIALAGFLASAAADVSLAEPLVGSLGFSVRWPIRRRSWRSPPC